MICYLTDIEVKVSRNKKKILNVKSAKAPVPPESVEEGNDLLPAELEGRFGAAGLRKCFNLLLREQDLQSRA